MPPVRSDSIELKLRVIVVTTRAALRHARGDAGVRREIVGRGQALLDAIESDAGSDERPLIEQARADIEALVPD